MKRQILSLTLFFIAIASFSSPTERTISLNGVWNFKADYYDKGETQQWFLPDYSDAGWDKVNVPSNWDTRNEYAEFTGIGWYRTVFETPTAVEGKIVRLNFETVGIDYKVWLNGTQIANVTGGYFSNYLDITNKMKPGAKNCLVVCADNTFRSGAYWSWGGIRRPVTLIVNNPAFIQSVKVLSVPDLQKGTAIVSVGVNLFKAKEVITNAVIDYELSFAGKVFRKGSQAVNLKNGGVEPINFQLALSKKELKLWHFDFPNLYTIQLQLKQNGVLMHELSERFGVRKLEIADGKLLLNGESVRLLGYNWVADDRFTGNTLPAELFKRDIDNMKSMGGNFTRLSHVPLPEDVLDYLDEKGMMIISEIPVWGTTKLADPDNATSKSWIRQLVTTSFNHPSIVGWSVGNEIGNKIRNPRVMEYVEKAIKYVKDSLDNSRFVVAVSHTANSQSQDPSLYGDFVPYNSYSGWANSIAKVHEKQPKKLIFLSEYGENLIGEDLNTSTGNLVKILAEIRGKDYLFGASLWTYNDYRSSYRTNKLTWDSKLSQNRDWGVVDGYGNKKRAYEIIRKEYAPLRQFNAKDTANTIVVTMQPRQQLDLPAYILRNYKLLCKELDNENKLLRTQEILLPLVKPGDEIFTKQFKTKTPLNVPVAARQIVLVSPSGYELADTTLYYAAPLKPTVKAVFYNGSNIRVVFNQSLFTTEYKLRYTPSDFKQKSGNTIDNYIELANFDLKKVSADNPLQLVAINGFGETAVNILNSELITCVKFPPLIKAVKAFQNGINIGYSSEKGEYLYKVQYSTSSDFSSNTHIIRTTSKGACYIPDLVLGKKYYVRMLAVEQYDIESEWSETYAVQL